MNLKTQSVLASMVLGFAGIAGAEVVTTTPGAVTTVQLANTVLSIKEGSDAFDPSTQYGVSDDYFLWVGDQVYRGNDFNFRYISSLPEARNPTPDTRPVITTLANGFNIDLRPSGLAFSGGIPLGEGTPDANGDCCSTIVEVRLQGFDFTPDAGYRVERFVFTASGRAVSEGGNTAARAFFYDPTGAVQPDASWAGNEQSGLGDPWLVDGTFSLRQSFTSLASATTLYFEGGAVPMFMFPGGLWSFSVDSLSVEALVVAVPEPSTWALSLVAGAALLWRVRRRR